MSPALIWKKTNSSFKGFDVKAHPVGPGNCSAGEDLGDDDGQVMLAPTNDRHAKVVRRVLQDHCLLPTTGRLREKD